MKVIKKILIALLIVLALIQFIRPEKNLSGDNTYAIQTKYNVPPEISTILDGACNDCHTNTTKYPWYANVQPAAWWLANHVNEGKEHLNFSEFTNQRIAVQNHKLEEVVEMVKEKEMPLPSYTWFGLHPEADLSDKQRADLTLWAQSLMAQIAAKYPADSLVLRRR
jgi:hypothetical protein